MPEKENQNATRWGVLSSSWTRLRGLLQHLSGDATALESGRLDRRLLARMNKTLADCVAETGGEVSARQRAAWLGQTYLGLEAPGRMDFLRLLLALEPDPAPVTAAAQAWLDAADEAQRADAAITLRKRLASPRVQVLRQFNGLPDGVHLLVSMREDLLHWSRKHPELARLDADFYDLLASWFDIGFLEMRRITWEAPAALLEKLIAYEAVHAITSWTDLRNRLDSDRRCYAFFHPRMPDEPLIFVEVALCRKLAGNVQSLLDQSLPTIDPEGADTAIFYSISTTQPGLRGVSFGNFLIKRVVGELQAEFPRLKTFATLSPIPGFCRWLGDMLSSGKPLLSADEAAALKTAASTCLPEADGGLQSVLDCPAWWQESAVATVLEAPLIRLATAYLVPETQSAELDPVARFHLGNGARIERLNWLGDLSERGMRQSAGIMVNYLYDLSSIEANHEAFSGQGKIAVSPAVNRSRPKKAAKSNP
jgi:malonyl-CoA decarboxylase